MNNQQNWYSSTVLFFFFTMSYSDTMYDFAIMANTFKPKTLV